jgi:glucose/mannose-6-phosphate isomerase
MRELVLNFPNQLKRAFEIAENAQLNPKNGIRNVLISGLGGSGIGATIINNFSIDSAKKPISINKGYFLPKFVNQNTLVICCSYSGNTEETMYVLHKAFELGAPIVCISSGGKMIDFCKKNGLDYIQIDGGMPPRSCLGYSMVQLAHVLGYYKIIPQKISKEIFKSIALLEKEQPKLDKITKELAEKISDKLPIIYSEENFEGVAVRYRQQINENSKMLCWHHVIPEMNHNEMVGWRDNNDKLAVLFLNNASDYERNQERKLLNEAVMKKYTPYIFNINSKGKNRIEQSFYQIHFADLLSCHLAEIRGFDASEIDVINSLKGALDKKPII